MRQFKLIKKYPGSENIGSIYKQGKDFLERPVYIKDESYLDPADVEDNPEFFEEIIERIPLFVTEDGVEIFEGDSVWGFYIGYGEIFEMKDLQRAKEEQWLKFSSKEKAKEYILMSKPCLSIKEITNNEVIFGNLGFVDSNMQKRLKELVKSRL